VTEVSTPGPLELLVLQPTPFCNINCTYCYLPDRESTRTMSAETLEQTFRWVFSSGLVREDFTLLWHAGEPLVLAPTYYEQAMSMLDRCNTSGRTVHHSFQTNATLINDEWCKFVLRYGIHVGVSVDGPAFLHDRRRRTRQGRGTLDRVLAGIARLNDCGVPFDVITVLTAESLDHPDELFDFYRANGISRVGFNSEEIEGPNTASSLSAAGTEERFRRFLSRFLHLSRSADPPMQVREFVAASAVILGERWGEGSRTQENKPWAIVNVDCDGNFGTYSPELLGIPGKRYESFVLGNVTRDGLDSVIASERFRRIETDVAAGVEQCRKECRYYEFCGGGAPANKFFENGTFASTRTLCCRLHKMACLDVALDSMERERRGRRLAAEKTAQSQLAGAEA